MSEELVVHSGDFIKQKQGMIRETYRIGSKVGDGAYGSVRRVTHRDTGEVRAVKTIHKKNLRTQAEKQALINEVNVLKALDHPNILKLYEFFEDSQNYYLITEFCQGGELFQRIVNCGSFSESTAAYYMKQILSVTAYCHDHNVIHRDLKPENFLLESQDEPARIKVIDFGTAQFFTPGSRLSQKYGTPYYIAPEVLRRNYDQQCDVWSCGVNMYILLCGFPPFTGNTDEQIFKQISVGRFSFPSPEWDNITFEAKDLITKMLNYNAQQRITAREALAHPWLEYASQTPLNHNEARKIFTNLQSFQSNQKLQQATLTFIATQLATKQERDDIYNIFQSLDTDNSGTLSRQELIEGYHLIYGDADAVDIDTEVDRIMQTVDTDKSGEIDYTEFVVATLNRQKLLSRERLEMAFKAFDLDGSGGISADELKQLLGKQGHDYEKQVWSDMIQEADINGDGEIDLGEFIEMMMRFTEI